MGTMAKRAYEASGRSDDGAIPVLLVAAIGSGIAAGVIEGYVSQWLSLVILFPLLIGLAAGGVAAWLIRAKNVRAPGLALVIGSVGGVCGALAVLVVRYLLVRAEVGEELGFFEWYEMAAEVGTTLSRHGSGGAAITGIGYHLFTAVNVLISAGVGGWTARAAANEPFCEHCKHWYDADEVIFSSSGEKDAIKQTTTWLENGEMARAILESPSETDKRALLFQVNRCATCQTSDPILALKQLIKGKKQQVNDKWKSVITPDQLAEMQKAAQTKTVANA